ncbi:serine/threonine-protein kinase [Nonomuraea sp. ATR24]|uniref:serine/threonine-protein kinase n=1 Tax=Nonomuraea TaxID=83681 RepID=UPI001C604111|nr:serine/threonine-protein kinase [Nonomuraea ceibae]
MLPVEDAPGYRVLDQAGQGGFAVVYRAYQERLDRVVALKVLSVDRVDQRTMRRFQRELQLTGRLTGHPNVVTVFDTGVTRSGKPYIAMDFFENGSLRDKLRNEGPFPVAEVLRTGVKLAGALAAVHEAGVLHGDIKPQNILISRYGEPAVADFGVARVVDSAEISATSQAFTPLHAAPEVLTGQPHSVSTDVYSLGSTLYHLLAGQPAFHSPTDPSIAPLMYRVLSAEPPPIDRPDVPPVVTRTVLRAMAKQPELRYGSAREFGQRLRQVQAELGLPVTDLLGEPAAPQPAASQVAVPQAAAPHAVVPQPTVPQPASYGPPPGAGPGAPGGTGTGSGAGGATAWQQSAAPRVTRPAGYEPPPPQRTSRLGVKVAVTASVTAVAVAGTVLAVWLSLQRADPPATLPTARSGTSEPQSQSEAPTIDRRSVAALAPRQVKVTSDRGALVELSWALTAKARRYPVVVQRSPVEKGGQPLTPVEAGATSARIGGLDPDQGYCFVVGVPLDIAESSTVAWSKPACIRGARPAS